MKKLDILTALKKVVAAEDNLKKTTWDALLNAMKKGVMYMGSKFHTTPEQVTELLANFKKPSFEADRVLDKGSSVLQLTKPDGGITRLDKRGVVYKYDTYFIVHVASDGDNVIVYRES
jgi:hypothetical protein